MFADLKYNYCNAVKAVGTVLRRGSVSNGSLLSDPNLFDIPTSVTFPFWLCIGMSSNRMYPFIFNSLKASSDSSLLLNSPISQSSFPIISSNGRPIMLMINGFASSILRGSKSRISIPTFAVRTSVGT